ncbi:hypothetical protein [Vibrio algivorus]|uniref:Uncharacterized protein n=1 Tax=Vibrio algivorus TaxID=1667024 RepID=A0ABQ6EQH9_9VIBR|nr:hypothetical protein [Vibrio algivorus]GLT15001.1 hypothetical protein GCM10007931_19760 [Vibrio algivorus]
MTDDQLKEWQKLSHYQRRYAVAWWLYGVKSFGLETGIVWRSNVELYEIISLKPPKNRKSLVNAANRLWTRNNNQLERFIYGIDGIHWNNDRLRYYSKVWGFLYPNAGDYPFSNDPKSVWVTDLKYRYSFTNGGKLDLSEARGHGLPIDR